MDDKNHEVVDLSDIEGAYGLGPEPPRIDQKDGVTKCASCVGKWVRTKADIDNDVLHNGQVPILPPVNDAVTWLPTWESTTIQGQLVMACVALPSCLDCCTIKNESPIERATKSGLALGGQGIN
jgi:hypothetical protein